jgi:hypothetical protein
MRKINYAAKFYFVNFSEIKFLWSQIYPFQKAGQR